MVLRSFCCLLLIGLPVLAEEPLLEVDVLPILTRNCLGCHGGLHQEGGLDLRTIPAMFKGGDSGPALIKGNGKESPLWERIASDEMPAGDEREKLSAAEKAIIKAWIDAGLPTLSARQRKVASLLPSDRKHNPDVVADAIDQHLDNFLTAASLKPVQVCADEVFLRRIYLDLSGRIPTVEQTVNFLDETSPDKRSRLIDELLTTPEFGQQFGRTWRDWICPPELPSDNNGGAQPYDQANRFGDWIGKNVTEGESWDKITRDILTVRGEIKTQPQVIFYGLVGYGGKTDPAGTTRAVASLFMGVQLQCAQCHDDPYRDWSQKEYWGVAAFFGRVQGDFNKINVGNGPSKKPGEIVIPNSAFRNSGNVIPATFLNGQPFQQPGKDDLRAPFVDWLTQKDNPYFARSFVNRIWFSLFSQGIVNPVDDFRELNPPSHPGLMKLLAEQFTASGYDIQHLFRCLCNTDAYQRTSRVDPQMDEPQRLALTGAFGRMPLRVMNADRFLESLKLAYGETKDFDLRGGDKVNTTGQAATVGNAYLEFHRKFGTNEEDPTDFTHGIAQMLTLINHSRLRTESKTLDDYLKQHKDATAEELTEWLYLRTLSRYPSAEERTLAADYIKAHEDRKKAVLGMLWMLVNRSEFLLIR